MSRLGYLFWIAVSLACGSLLAEEIRWAPNLVVARRASVEYKVPLLIHFYGDNCLPCKVLDQNVLSKAEVVDTLNKYFICVRINASQERQTAAEYGVHSWPTDVFVSPDGATLDQGVCKQNAADYLAVLQHIAVQNRDRNVLLAANSASNSALLTSQSQNYSAAQSAPSQPAYPALPAANPPAANNPVSPNLYVQNNSGMQQLPASLAPNLSVTSGPPLPQNQPTAVRTAVQASVNQIEAGATAHILRQEQNQLPTSSAAAAMIPPPSRSQAGGPDLSSFAQMPTNASNSKPYADELKPRSSAWDQSGKQNPNAQTVANPHFVSSSAPQIQPAQGSNSTQPPVPAIPSNDPTSNLAAANSTSSPPNPATAMSEQPQLPPLGQPAVPQYAAGQFAGNSVRETATAETRGAEAVAQPKIPASTVSFQPRKNSQPEDAENAVDSTPVPTAVQAFQSTPGIDGYCPIALRNSAEWIKGKSQFAVRHRGKVYWMSSQKAMTDFLANPDRSSPVLSGFDPMLFLTEGRLVEGSVQFGLHEEDSGSVLLFSSAATKQAYEQDFDRLTRALEEVLRVAGVQ